MSDDSDKITSTLDAPSGGIVDFYNFPADPQYNYATYRRTANSGLWFYHSSKGEFPQLARESGLSLKTIEAQFA